MIKTKNNDYCFTDNYLFVMEKQLFDKKYLKFVESINELHKNEITDHQILLVFNELNKIMNNL